MASAAVTAATVASGLVSDDIGPAPLTLTTTDGIRLEAEQVVPSASRAGLVLCHPHPLHGGNMRSLVGSELFRILPAHRLAALRFNFRGVEGSEGDHGAGVTEVADVVAAVAALADRVGEVPVVVAGWSFGADVALRRADPAVAGWVAIAPPLRIVDPTEMETAADPRPKLLIVPEHDQFDPPDRVRSVTAGWQATRVDVIAGADHFLVGRTDQVAARVVDFVDALLREGRYE